MMDEYVDNLTQVPLEEIHGVITSFHFRQDDFVIASFKCSITSNDLKIKGSLYGVEKGEEIIVKGQWEDHPKYGKQFSIARWERPMPNTKDQVISFLASPLIKGCSAKQAVVIADRLGENAIDIINDTGEEALVGIKGIGKKRSSQIVNSIRSTFEVQKIISALLVYGITANMALKAYKKFGSNTVNVVEKNPYKLVEIDLVGFLKADEIAMKLGILPTSSYRIDACVSFILKKMCFDAGHCFIPEHDLYKDILLALNHNVNQENIISLDELKLSLHRLEEHHIVNENNCVYPKFLYKYEDELAENISFFMNNLSDGGAMPNFDVLINKLIKTYENKNSIVLAVNQKLAIQKLMNEQILILTGGPGTGKTTVTKAMIEVFKMIYPKARIALAAPTGRASRKLSEVTGMEASTIHKLIGYKQGDKPEYNATNKLQCDLLVIDEMSMVDLQLAYLLLKAVKSDTKILFVGDIDQLPSVNPGNVLSDLIAANVPTVKLNEVFRQAQESQIITNAHRINKGMPLSINSSKNDFYFIEQQDPEAIAQLIVLSVIRFLKLGYSISDILVLSPMKKGSCGILALNEKIRKFVNPASEEKNELIIRKRLYREGDKIIQLRNNTSKDLSNGDIGIIKTIQKERNNDGDYIDVVMCEFAGRIVKYYKDELHEVELAYAITIHKSQGGESPIVIIPVTTSQYIMLARNLMYTGLTRAKNIMVFVGCHRAMNIAINNNAIAKRNSRLTEKIHMYVNRNNRYKSGITHCI